MSRAIRALVLGSLVLAAACVFRKRLVHLLTATTGTWVGSPDR